MKNLNKTFENIVVTYTEFKKNKKGSEKLMKKEEKGITLVALVVTIIVLLILTGVSIVTITGEDGVIQRTLAARWEQERAQYQDFIDLAQAKVHMADWKGDKTAKELLEGIQEILDAEEYFDGAHFEIKDENIAEPTLIIQTKQGHQFKVTEEEVEYIGSKEDIGDITAVEKGDIITTVTPTTWTNQNVKVKIEVNNENYTGYQEGYELEYSEDLKAWEKYTGEFEVGENTFIYPRVINKNTGEQIFGQSMAITKIDKIAPEFTISAKSTGIKSFELTANFNDASSGLSKITWYYQNQYGAWIPVTDTYQTMNGTEAGENNTSKTKGSFSLYGRELTKGGEYKVYAEAWDVAGNKVTSDPFIAKTSQTPLMFNANGGTGAPETQFKYYGVNITLPETIPTRTGYTFLGWSNSSTATAASWQAGGNYNEDSYSTLYAVWKANTYNIAYTLNGGTAGSSAPSTGTYDQVITISNPTRTGYTFTGWTASGINTNTAKYGPSKNPSANSWNNPNTKVKELYFTNLSSTNGATVTLVANWKDETKPTINLTASPTTWTNGDVTLTGTAQDTGSGIVAYAWTTTSTNPTSWTNITQTTAQMTQTKTVSVNGPNYFWTKDGAGNINSASVTITNIDKVAPTLTLSTSSIGANSFTLSADVNDVTSGLSKITWYYKRPQDGIWQSVTDTYSAINGSVTKTRSFTGLTQGGQVAVYAEAWDAAGNKVTSYAQNNPLRFFTSTYTITYNANGGTGAPASQTKYYGVDLQLDYHAPSKTGYMISGWSKDRNATSSTWTLGSLYTDNASATLYAVWYDGTKPTISLTASPTTWTNGNVTLTGISQDTGSGIVAYAWTTTSTTPTSWNNITQTTAQVTQTTTLSANGTWYFWTKDGTGNTNNASVTVTNIDITKPTISLTPNTTATANSVTLTGISQDTGSGILAYAWTDTATLPTSWITIYPQTTAQITETITLTANGTKYFWTKDGAGNTNNAAVTVSNIVAKANTTVYNNLTLLVGNSGTPGRSTTGSPKSWIFTSSNTNVATIDASTGVVTAKAAGTAIMTLTCTNYDGTTDSKSCTVTVQNGIAAVGGVHYASITNAVGAISTSGTIAMLASTTESPTIPAGKTIALALNGMTITGKITNNGSLTINGSGTIKNSSDITMESSGTLIIDVDFTGTISNNSGAARCIYVKAGTTKVRNGTVTYDGSATGGRTIGVAEDATCYLSGGTIKNTKDGRAVVTNGNLYIIAQKSNLTITNKSDTYATVRINSTGLCQIKKSTYELNIKNSGTKWTFLEYDIGGNVYRRTDKNITNSNVATELPPSENTL